MKSARDARAGSEERVLRTKADEVKLKVPKLRHRKFWNEPMARHWSE
ncbi:MAG: transposase [Pararhodobacter sp.]|nr:transposase [Pararhodobacter sp.]